jgi:flagellar protein FliJ
LKRFRFRLEQVLRVRRVQEDMARGALLLANRGAQRAAASVNERIAEYAAASRPNGAQTYEAFNRMQFDLDNAAGAITVARAEYRHALAVVDQHRADWAAARQRVAALERLEERRREEHAVEARRAEDRLVDDLVVARHARGVHARGVQVRGIQA